MEQLMRTLQNLHAGWAPLAGRPFAPRYGAEVYGVALETRNVPQQYYWDGDKRSSDASHPFVVFQYTLAGWGCYAEGHTVTRILPQMAFVALVPSDSRYYLPPESNNWPFCWLIIRHPYVVSRIVQRISSIGSVFQLAPSSMLMARAVQLLEGIYYGTFHDAFAEEQALFDFLIEFERVAYHLTYSQAEREGLLQDVRSYVLQTLREPIEVEQIATNYGMSRSHFSHHFKRTTGIAPAQFIVQVRLEEATHRLLHSTLTLEEIADETGFANANHFCKVFRRHFHLSPGEFRRQMRSGPDPVTSSLVSKSQLP